MENRAGLNQNKNLLKIIKIKNNYYYYNYYNNWNFWTIEKCIDENKIDLKILSKNGYI